MAAKTCQGSRLESAGGPASIPHQTLPLADLRGTLRLQTRRCPEMKPYRFARVAGFIPHWAHLHYGNGALPLADLRQRSSTSHEGGPNGGNVVTVPASVCASQLYLAACTSEIGPCPCRSEGCSAIQWPITVTAAARSSVWALVKLCGRFKFGNGAPPPADGRELSTWWPTTSAQ